MFDRLIRALLEIATALERMASASEACADAQRSNAVSGSRIAAAQEKYFAWLRREEEQKP